MDEIAQNMKKARTDAGLSQPQLSELSGVPQRTIAQWEQGRSIPTVIYCDAVAGALGLTIDEYINGVVPKVSRKKVK